MPRLPAAAIALFAAITGAATPESHARFPIPDARFPKLQTPSPRPQTGAPDLSPLQFLLGHCWSGQFPGNGPTDTHCFDWLFAKSSIRDHHVVSSTPKYEGETIYSWDAASNAIAFRYWSNAGLVLDGTVEQHGDTLVFPSHYVKDDGTRVDMRAVWTRVGTDAYRAESSALEGGEWKVQFAIVYRRTDGATRAP